MAQVLEEEKSWHYRSHTVLRVVWGQKQYQLSVPYLENLWDMQGWSR